MITFYNQYIRPAFTNFSWKPNRELVIVLTIIAIILGGAIDVFNGDADLATALEVAVLAIVGLFTRGQSTTLVEPRDQDGRPLTATDTTDTQ